MKIAIVDSTIHSLAIGGAQVYLPALLKGLVERGHDVHLITDGEPNSFLTTALINSGAHLQKRLWSIWSLPIEKARRLANWLNEQCPDVYVISVSADVGWLSLPMLNARIRTLAIAHTNIDAFYLPAAYYKQFLTAVIGVSDEISQQYESISKIEGRRIKFIPYGVQPAIALKKTTASAPLRLIYVGRLEDVQKRITDLIPAIRQLSVRGIRYEFQIVGDGSKRDLLQRAFSQELQSGSVNFAGWVNNDDIRSYYQNSDIFVLMSSYEGFSIALTEAMANGCCPIVTDIAGGSKQLINDGVNGFLVPVGDIAKFTERILALHDDRELLNKIREAAWATGSQYSVETMVERYESWFQSVCETFPETDRQQCTEFPVMPSCRSRYPDWIRKIKIAAARLGISEVMF